MIFIRLGVSYWGFFYYYIYTRYTRFSGATTFNSFGFLYVVGSRNKMWPCHICCYWLIFWCSILVYIYEFAILSYELAFLGGVKQVHDLLLRNDFWSRVRWVCIKFIIGVLFLKSYLFRWSMVPLIMINIFLCDDIVLALVIYLYYISCKFKTRKLHVIF